jgi:hypothetical protein
MNLGYGQNIMLILPPWSSAAVQHFGVGLTLDVPHPQANSTELYIM